MATQPEEISRQSSPLVPSEDLRQSGYVSSTEGSSAGDSSAGGSGEGPKGRRRSLRVIILLTDVVVLVLSLGHLTLTVVLMCYNGRPVDASYDILQSVLTTVRINDIAAFYNRLFQLTAHSRSDQYFPWCLLSSAAGFCITLLATDWRMALHLGHLNIGNSTFYLESSHLQLNCDSATSHKLHNSTQSFLEAETPLIKIELNHANKIALVSEGNRTFPVTKDGRTFVNGSWYGFQHAQSQYTEWNIAVDRFVDKFWFTAFGTRHYTNKTKYDLYLYPNMGVFENETAIEAGPTYLLFQTRRNITFQNFDLGKDEFRYFEVQKAKCLVLQKYVESRATCSRATHESTADCRVESQRPSQKQHPSENLSILSHPYVFAHLAKNLPTTVQAGGASDPTLWSISDQPEPLIFDRPMLPNFTNISASQLSRGLTKVINSYMLIRHADKNLLPRQLSGDFEGRGSGKYWSLTSAETTHLTRVFSVSLPWMAACFASCGVLAACGIMGIILVHRGNSPEILGFVSAIVRDSRYITIPTDVDHMNGEDLSRMLKSERLRYGYTSFESREAPQMGIGRETEITKIEGS
ncbi:unnamed protein product [Clonostachys solani]|uniref:Uncharacterized protein n=1 Tax=Clonostachys solani TaxID=160281 RepID=A0A9N9YYT0_9HYPO|nr:unnamed protein product [Clonostachys solani]